MFHVKANLRSPISALAVVLVVLLIGLQGDASTQSMLATGAAFALAAVGMDVMTGYGGLPNVGQGAFVAIGAYGSVALATHTSAPFVVCLLFAVALAAVVAGVIGVGAVRLAHAGLAVVTFSFAWVVYVLLNGSLLSDFTSSANGLPVLPGTIAGVDVGTGSGLFIFGLLLLALTVLAISLLLASRWGHALLAVKRSEQLAAAVGINPFRAKMEAFVVAAMCGGLAGVIIAQTSGFISPEGFPLTLGIVIFSIAGVGGLGSICGPVVAAFVYVLVADYGASHASAALLWPALLLLTLMFLPTGFFGLLRLVVGKVRNLYGRKTSVPTSSAHEISAPQGHPHDIVAEPALVRSGSDETQEPNSSAHQISAPQRHSHDIVAEPAFVRSRSDETQDRTSSAHEISAPQGHSHDIVAEPAFVRLQSDEAQDPTSSPVLSVRGVSLAYGGVTALSNVTLNVGRSSIHALVGPNGAGKTSMLDVLTGVAAPSQGEVHLDDRLLSHVPARKRGAVGCARSFQHPALVGDLNVRQNVELGLRVRRDRRRMGRAGRAQAVDSALTAAGVPDDLWGAYPTDLSGGHQKLVDLARALVAAPKVLLLDEPTSGVTDEEAIAVAHAIGRAVDSGCSALIIDHNVGFVRRLADRVTVLDHGRVIADGETLEVLARPEVIEAFVGVETTHV